MSAPPVDRAPLSAECTLALRPGYRGLHRECRQTRDVPLPHGRGLLLQRRCGCGCHGKG
ncbi:hypothetical protein AB0N97_38005 [Streptomyces collinus]|uniref:Uncharacterized protein n=1 Tax=Streptomyces violaceochromogenes TaxID=67377 RepID=A0ABU6LPH3_9ACTN|nr:hypothetical protein [Streptomyces violaceochromogenes]MEC7051396.1 hypothetical protein [Streptomyces violaceochromogenes]